MAKNEKGGGMNCRLPSSNSFGPQFLARYWVFGDFLALEKHMAMISEKPNQKKLGFREMLQIYQHARGYL